MTALAPTPTTRGADGLARRAFTVEEIDRMFEAGVLDRDEKFELIHGEIVPVSPQQLRHSVMRNRIMRCLMQILPPDIEVSQETTLRLGARQLYDADILLSPPLDPSKSYFPVEKALLVIEVSDTTLWRDREVKAPEYGKAGLAELWVLDVEAGQTLRMRQPGPHGYGEVLAMPFSEQLAPLCAPGAALRMAELLR